MDLGDKPLKDALATFRLIMDMAEAAVQKDRYDIAGRLASAAQRIARDGKDPLTTKQLAEYVTDLQKRARQFEALEPQLTRLADDPTDADANLAVGRFRALEQHRWREGIALLALSSDAELAKLAGRELAEPTAATERLAIADAWWELAEARKADAKALRRHAADCDLRALPNLAGLTKKKVETRLAEIEKWHSKDATYTVHPAGKEGDDRKYPPLPTLLNNVDKFHRDGDFAFHIADRYAHIIIDLKKEVAVSRLQILNRATNGDRARNMRVYLSNSPGSRGEQIWQAPDGAAEWNVLLNRLHVGRYLVITRDFDSDHDAYLHLRKVKVFGPE
jgi:hypothetical protein